MKVHYQKTITEKIDEAILEAARNNRVIDCIELTPAEWRTLLSTLMQLPSRPLVPVRNLELANNKLTYNGVTIKQSTAG